MKYLLDTCVISEFTKSTPEVSVVSWLRSTPIQQLYISVLTLGEIQKGISLLPVSMRRQHLQSWLDFDLVQQFNQRIVEIHPEITLIWGQISAQAMQQGKKLPVIDSLLAATALSEPMTLVTRNIKDFSAIEGLHILNPWEI